VFAGGLYFYFSLGALRETSVRNREEFLVLMRNTFENLISQFDNSVALSQPYLQLYRNYFDQGRYTVLLQLHAELQSVSEIKHINGICIYYRDWEKTVSSDSGLTGLADLELNPDALFLRSLDFTGFRYQRTLIREKPVRNGESIMVLSIIRSIPVYYHTDLPEAWIVIDIDLASLNDVMEKIFDVEDSYFSIIRDNGMPLVSMGSSSIKEILDGGINNFRMRAAPSGITRMEYSGYLILYAPSHEREWSFVYIEPN
jgi:hypothetical protein